ncbi:hypothetical protein OFB78_31010, partial [Escherichia coli]|nr:hypothetical protein [Escherichia coli]
MTDLDLGMNDHVSEPLKWDDSRSFDRGKVLSAAQLESIYKSNNDVSVESNGLRNFHGKYGRYL